MGWQLLRAYRDQSGQPKQRLMVSLGCVQLPCDELGPMAKAIERHLCAQDDLFAEQGAVSTLSTDAAYWIDRICRQIIRDGRFRNPHSVSEPSTARNAVPPDVVCSPQRVFIDQIEHTHSVVLGPLLVAKAAWEQLELSKCLRGVRL